MEKEFITYEQALALKELGFDEKCFGFYADKTGDYQLYMLPEATHFERGDILTEDKYHGHQIYVSFSGTNTNGEHSLILDNASQHPDIKKPFTEKLLKDLELGLHLFKHEACTPKPVDK